MVLPAFRSLHSSNRIEQAEQEAPTRVPVPPETGVPVTRRAQAGSLQLSLETPQNKAGSIFFLIAISFKVLLAAEYVLSTLDKVTNWARQGSMWPMTFGAKYMLLLRVVYIPNWFRNPRSRLLCRRDDAYGRRQIRPR